MKPGLCIFFCFLYYFFHVHVLLSTETNNPQFALNIKIIIIGKFSEIRKPNNAQQILLNYKDKKSNYYG